MNSVTVRVCIFILSSLFVVQVTGCQTAYYKTMEKFGYHKRDILADRVVDAKETQEEAKEQFKSALEKFSAVVNFKGGKLEDKYNQLNDEYEKSEEKAKDVSKRIESVEGVAEDLFEEWNAELDQYTNSSLRRSSEKQLKQTKTKYTQLIGAMKRAEKKIAPVLSAFRDQVLFLKHNLNAQAIASLQGELISIEADVASLIREMEASINEADSFIQSIAE
ncbi:MAG: DNA repair protein [Nitrospira bacterium SG8_35_4]|nr:MAG: DNA repair protein [Nitrospira bacterium SG8_35_4]